MGEALHSNCKGVHVLLVDERSLIGATTLGWMEFMCRCGMNNGSSSDKSWGGLPVVVFLGDDVQLPPVLDSPVYNCHSKSPTAIHGVLVWGEFHHAVTLNKIIRQDVKEKMLKNVLSSLREYNTTADQAKWLQQFQWENLKISYGEQLQARMFERGLFEFPTHNEEWNHNKLKLTELNKTCPMAKLLALSHGRHSSSSASSERCGGLSHTLYICKNAMVMLAVNLSVQYEYY